RPGLLLPFEGVKLDRDLRRWDHAWHEHESPAAQLRAIAEVEIFGERVVLPAAGVVDRRPPPHAGGAVEVEEPAAAVAAAVLEDEMAVEQDRLDLGEQRVVLVDVPPARLHHRDFAVAEVRHQPGEEIAGRDEVGVEDGNELATRHLQAGLERARLVADAIEAVVVLDVDALRGEAANGEFSDT